MDTQEELLGVHLRDKYSVELEDNTTKVQWVISGVPLRPTIIPDQELADCLGVAMEGQQQWNVQRVLVRDRPTKDTTIGFAVTTGATKALHKAVEEGVTISWKENDYKLHLAEFEARDENFMNVALKVHGMAEVELGMVQDWVNRLTGWDLANFKVVVLPYASEVKKFEGTAVYGIYTQHVDQLRRLYLQTLVKDDVHPEDKGGRLVTDWFCTMPFVKREETEMDFGRKIFMRGTGRVSSRNLAKTLVQQMEMIRRNAVDVFAITDGNKMETGGAFLVMSTHQQAEDILNKYGLINESGYPMQLARAYPRKVLGEKRSYAQTVGGGGGYGGYGGGFGHGGGFGGGVQGGATVEQLVEGVDRLLQEKYTHIANQESLHRQIRGGIQAEKKLFADIAHEANKVLFNRLLTYMQAIQVAVDGIGRAMAEAGGVRYERGMVTPQVHRELANIVGQKRAAAGMNTGVTDGSDLPPPIPEGATMEQCTQFMQGLLGSEVGRQFVLASGQAAGQAGQAAGQDKDKDRYSPPNMWGREKG